MLEIEVEKGISINEKGFTAEIPDAPVKFSKREKDIWGYVTQALFEYGLLHKTDGLLLTVIVKTFVNWIKAEEKVSEIEKENGSIYVVTPNGYEQPHQAVYESRKLKKELLQWLPEAALTIPSFNKVISSMEPPAQGSLFEDPIEKYREDKRRMGLRGINGGKT